METSLYVICYFLMFAVLKHKNISKLLLYSELPSFLEFDQKETLTKG